jgi:uncharacterized repeat protein (TIGR01451 family)
LPNPRPGVGVQDLAASGGALYALTGYAFSPLEVFKLDPSSGDVLAGPTSIAGPAVSTSDGFTVLPDGNFLINNGDASCTYHQYDGSTGALVSGTTITVPGAGRCTGADNDGTSLFFQTDFSSFTQTDLSGNLVAKTTVSSNSVEDISLVQPAATADLSITKSGSPNPVVSGQQLTYTIKATNTGGLSATGVTVSDRLPASAHFDSVSTSQGSCTRSTSSTPKTKDGTVSCGVGALAGGASATITIVVTPTKPGTVTNTATVSATNVTPSDADDSATATTTVTGT